MSTNTLASQDFGVTAASISYVTSPFVSGPGQTGATLLSFVFEALTPINATKALIHARHVTSGTLYGTSV